MVLRREIRGLETKIELLVELSNFERPRGLNIKLDRAFIHLCGMVAMIVCGDIYRQAMRLNVRQIHMMICIDMVTSGLPDGLRESAPVGIESLLEELAPSAGSNEGNRSKVEPT